MSHNTTLPSALPSEENVAKWQQSISTMTHEQQDIVQETCAQLRQAIHQENFAPDDREAVVWVMLEALHFVTQDVINPDIFQNSPSSDDADTPKEEEEEEDEDVVMEHDSREETSPRPDNFIVEDEHTQTDSRSGTDAWTQALVQRNIVHGNGEAGNPPLIVGGKGFQSAAIATPNIALSSDFSVDRLTEVIGRLETVLGTHTWRGKYMFTDVTMLLHPDSVTKLVSMVTQNAIGAKGLNRINRITRAAGTLSTNGISAIDVSIARQRAAQPGIPAQEKELFLTMSRVFDAETPRNDAFFKFKKMVDQVLFVDSFLTLVDAIEQNPDGAMGVRLEQVVPRGQGLTLPNRATKFAAKLMGWDPKEDEISKKEAKKKKDEFAQIIKRFKPVWQLFVRWGIGFLLLVDTDSIISVFNKTSQSVVPHFALIVNREFPEFRQLSMYLERQVVIPLCGTDREAFARVAGKQLSAAASGPDMFTRISAVFQGPATLE